MCTSARTLRSKAALACAALILLPACIPAPAGAPASPATAPSSPAVPSATSSSAAQSRTPVPTPATPTSSAPADVVQIRVTVRGGRVSPNGEKIPVRRGQTVALEVTSDAADELHAHTGDDDFSLAVQPGHTARGEFVAKESGTFEVELHELDLIVAILIVR